MGEDTGNKDKSPGRDHPGDDSGGVENGEDDVGLDETVETARDTYYRVFETFDTALLAWQNWKNRQRRSVQALIDLVVTAIAGAIILAIINKILAVGGTMGAAVIRAVDEIAENLSALTSAVSALQLFGVLLGIVILTETIQHRRISQLQTDIEELDNKVGKATDDGSSGEVRTDGGESEESEGTSGGGALGGAIAGAAAGSAFGPQGTLIGGILGAIAGNHIEKSQNRMPTTKVEEALILALIQKHAWGDSVAPEVLVNRALPPEEHERGMEVLESLPAYPFVQKTSFGYKLDPSEMEILANYLRNHVGWSDRRIRNQLPHYRPRRS